MAKDKIMVRKQFFIESLIVTCFFGSKAPSIKWVTNVLIDTNISAYAYQPQAGEKHPKTIIVLDFRIKTKRATVFRRFNYRGTAKVDKEFLLFAFGRNINKYHRFTIGKIQEFEGKTDQITA